jgi:hypothetical protein
MLLSSLHTAEGREGRDKVLPKQSALLKSKDCYVASQLAMTDKMDSCIRENDTTKSLKMVPGIHVKKRIALIKKAIKI